MGALDPGRIEHGDRVPAIPAAVYGPGGTSLSPIAAVVERDDAIAVRSRSTTGSQPQRA